MSFVFCRESFNILETRILWLFGSVLGENISTAHLTSISQVWSSETEQGKTGSLSQPSVSLAECAKNMPNYCLHKIVKPQVFKQFFIPVS